MPALSTVLRLQANKFDGKKVAAVEADVEEIDLLPIDIARSVTTIYLSSNNIDSLRYIGQFCNLVSLSLSHNRIHFLDQIESFSGLPNLKKLSLDGNQVTKVPFYDAHVLSICPTLISLDGNAVDDVRRAHSKVAYFKSRALFEQFSLCELRNTILAHVALQRRCLEELIRVTHGSFRSLKGGHIGASFLPSFLPTAMSEALGIQSVTSSLDSAAALSGGSQLFHSEDRSAERAISHVGSMSESVIHHALRGGVFRWLQTLATREFSRLIQADLAKLSRMMSARPHHEQKKQPVDTSVLTTSSATILYNDENAGVHHNIFSDASTTLAPRTSVASRHSTDSLVAEYGRLQQSVMVQLVEECETLSIHPLSAQNNQLSHRDRRSMLGQPRRSPLSLLSPTQSTGFGGKAKTATFRGSGTVLDSREFRRRHMQGDAAALDSGVRAAVASVRSHSHASLLELVGEIRFCSSAIAESTVPNRIDGATTSRILGSNTLRLVNTTSQKSVETGSFPRLRSTPSYDQADEPAALHLDDSESVGRDRKVRFGHVSQLSNNASDSSSGAAIVTAAALDGSRTGDARRGNGDEERRVALQHVKKIDQFRKQRTKALSGRYDQLLAEQFSRRRSRRSATDNGNTLPAPSINAAEDTSNLRQSFERKLAVEPKLSSSATVTHVRTRHQSLPPDDKHIDNHNAAMLPLSSTLLPPQQTLHESDTVLGSDVAMHAEGNGDTPSHDSSAFPTAPFEQLEQLSTVQFIARAKHDMSSSVDNTDQSDANASASIDSVHHLQQFTDSVRQFMEVHQSMHEEILRNAALFASTRDLGVNLDGLSMAELKANVQRLASSFTICRRSEFELIDRNQVLQQASEKFESALQSVADSYRTNVVAPLLARISVVDDDASAAATILKTAREVERMTNDLREQISRHEVARRNHVVEAKALQSAHSEAGTFSRKLLTSLVEVESATLALAEDVEHDANTLMLLRRSRLHQFTLRLSTVVVPSYYRELLVDVFRMWRAATVVRTNAGSSAALVNSKWRTKTLTNVFKIWHDAFTHNAFAAQVESSHAFITLKHTWSACVRVWYVRHISSANADRCCRTLRLSHALRRLKAHRSEEHSSRAYDCQLALFAQFFVGVRVFRAWRSYAIESVQRSNLRLYRYYLARQLHVLRLWREVTTRTKLDLGLQFSAVFAQTKHSRLSSTWRCWRTFAHFHMLLRRRRLLQRAIRRISRRCKFFKYQRLLLLKLLFHIDKKIKFTRPLSGARIPLEVEVVNHKSVLDVLKALSMTSKRISQSNALQVLHSSILRAKVKSRRKLCALQLATHVQYKKTKVVFALWRHRAVHRRRFINRTQARGVTDSLSKVLDADLRDESEEVIYCSCNEEQDSQRIYTEMLHSIQMQQALPRAEPVATGDQPDRASVHGSDHPRSTPSARSESLSKFVATLRAFDYLSDDDEDGDGDCDEICACETSNASVRLTTRRIRVDVMFDALRLTSSLPTSRIVTCVAGFGTASLIIAIRRWWRFRVRAFNLRSRCAQTLVVTNKHTQRNLFHIWSNLWLRQCARFMCNSLSLEHQPSAATSANNYDVHNPTGLKTGGEQQQLHALLPIETPTTTSEWIASGQTAQLHERSELEFRKHTLNIRLEDLDRKLLLDQTTTDDVTASSAVLKHQIERIRAEIAFVESDSAEILLMKAASTAQDIESAATHFGSLTVPQLAISDTLQHRTAFNHRDDGRLQQHSPCSNNNTTECNAEDMLLSERTMLLTDIESYYHAAVAVQSQTLQKTERMAIELRALDQEEEQLRRKLLDGEHQRANLSRGVALKQSRVQNFHEKLTESTAQFDDQLRRQRLELDRLAGVESELERRLSRFAEDEALVQTNVAALSSDRCEADSSELVAHVLKDSFSGNTSTAATSGLVHLTNNSRGSAVDARNRSVVAPTCPLSDIDTASESDTSFAASLARHCPAQSDGLSAAASFTTVDDTNSQIENLSRRIRLRLQSAGGDSESL